VTPSARAGAEESEQESTTPQEDSVEENQPAPRSEDQPHLGDGGNATGQEQPTAGRRSAGIQTVEKPEAGPNSGALSPLVQQQIADALAPLVGELQQRIADTVRQQVGQTRAEQTGDQNMFPSVEESPEPVSQQEQAEREEGENATQVSALQAAVQRTVTALRETLRWLGRTLAALFQTIKALLTAVVGLLQIIALALSDALTLLLRPVVRGLRAALTGIRDGINALLIKVLGKLVLAVLRSFLVSLLQKLSPPSRGETDSTQSDSSGQGPGELA
jgi:hypothetical protein